MSVVEEPTAIDNPLPPGTFVVIAIDPAASVKQLDDEAKREAAEITPTRCLALVDGDLNFEYVVGTQQLERIFLPAGKGLPPPPESWAAIPVAPAGPHPETDRQSVQPDFPLHWSDCYLYTLFGIIGRVSRIHQPHLVRHSLPEEEYDKVCLAVMKDGRRHGLAERARAQGQPTNSLPSSEDDDSIALPEEEDDVHSPQDDANCIPPGENDDLPRDEDTLSAHEEDSGTPELHPPMKAFGEATVNDWALADIIPKESVAPQLKMSYEVWVDTSTLDELGDPEQLIAEMNRLKEIEWEWAYRVVEAEQANQPDTEAWLAHLGDAEPPTSDIDNMPVYNAELDSLIVPEDAVENRDAIAILRHDSTASESPAALLEPESDSAAIYSPPPSAGSHSARGESLAPESPGSYTTPDMYLKCSKSTCGNLSDSPAPSRASSANPSQIQRKLFPE